jgi:hypothetical protein
MHPGSQDGCWHETLAADGFALLGLFDAAAVAGMTAELERILNGVGGQEASIRGQEGTIYAARNLLRLWPGLAAVWRQPGLVACLERVLGPRFGLVRVLYFDKPPQQTWALPWHKDLTIAVRNNRLPSQRFTHPTRKAGVPHIEAPVEVLETMLTARIHLDEVTDENGPLKVVPGSHKTGKVLTLDLAPPRAIHAAVGEVLLMRPLLAHCSGKSAPETQRHRRILHLEFAVASELPDGFEWHDFERCIVKGSAF